MKKTDEEKRTDFYAVLETDIEQVFSDAKFKSSGKRIIPPKQRKRNIDKSKLNSVKGNINQKRIGKLSFARIRKNGSKT